MAKQGMVKGFGLAFIGIMASLLGFVPAAHSRVTLQPGNLQLLVQGTMEIMAGSLFDEERRLNPLTGHASYVDGSTLDAKMKHDAWQYGFYGEYTLLEQMGLQAGIEFRTITQTVSAGGGSYEERVWGEGTLVNYQHPFLGLAYYAYNQDDTNFALTARVGKIMGGKIYPYVSTIDYWGGTPQGYTLAGYTLGVGTHLAWVYDFFVLGAAFFVTENFFQTAEKLYPDLDRNFTTFSYDLSLYTGVRF